MDTFESMHAAFIEKHLTSRKGERRARLERGHGFGERLLLQNVWWPVFGHFDHLHPEYEVYDRNRKSYFLDFAYLPPFGQFDLECDGYQSHIKEMDRDKFSYALNRDTFLTALGWRMLHFSFDDIKDRPEICQSLLRLAVGPYLLREKTSLTATRTEKDLLLLAWSLGRAIRPIDVSEAWKVNFRTSRKLLTGLADKGWLQPISKGTTIRYYELNKETLELLL
ncbi:hypothetical protein [Paenibacillus sinopodophylli]|uniref:hypothetical protein n=1 Tax=Paenibacillus sinopodophylli TaxID=1837342 RepID=UPI00110CB122|nr:hypothetical protein [Paenibacillus sinopodophylli]